MDVKDYLTPSFATGAEENLFTAKPQKKPAAATVPEIKVKVSGVDFFVTRKTKIRNWTLVCLMSQGILYIRDEKNKVDTPATVELLKSFFGGTDCIPLVDDVTGEPCPWLGELDSKKECLAMLVEIVSRKASLTDGSFDSVLDLFAAFAREGYARMTKPREFTSWKRIYDVIGHDAIYYIPEIFKRLNSTQKLSLASLIYDDLAFTRGFYSDQNEKNLGGLVKWMRPAALWTLENAPGWGVSGFCDFVTDFLNSPATDFPIATMIRDILGKACDGEFIQRKEITREGLAKYLFYNGTAEAGGSKISDFAESFWVYLNARDKLVPLTGREYPLYPDNLLSASSKLTAIRLMYSRRLENLQDGVFSANMQVLLPYEYCPDDSEYQITAPRTKADLLCEAADQCNSLSPFISQFANGERMMFFCRDKNWPQYPFVTISVLPDGTLDKVCGTMDCEVDPDVLAFIERWHKLMFPGNTNE